MFCLIYSYIILTAKIDSDCPISDDLIPSLNDQEDLRFIQTLGSLPLEQPKTTAKSDSDCHISDDCISIADRQSINVFQNTHRIFEGRDVRRGTCFP